MTLLYFFQKPAYVQQSAAYINKQNNNIRFEKNKKNAKEWSWKEWVLPLGKMAILLPKSTEKIFSGFVCKFKFSLLFANFLLRFGCFKVSYGI